jgi:hypothetical protein
VNASEAHASEAHASEASAHPVRISPVGRRRPHSLLARLRRACPARARGASALEVLMAAALIAVALVPIMGVSQSQEREAFELEYRTMAHWRARALVEAAIVAGVESLEERLLAAGVPAERAPDDPVPEMAVPDALMPAGTAVLEYQAAALRAPSPAAPGGGRAALFRDRLLVGRALVTGSGPAGPACLLYRVRARVTWVFPGDVARREHRYELARLVARAGASHRLLPALPAAAGPGGGSP